MDLVFDEFALNKKNLYLVVEFVNKVVDLEENLFSYDFFWDTLHQQFVNGQRVVDALK